MAAEVRVLGPVALFGDDGAVSLPAKHARLLAALAIADGRALGIDELIEAVWDGAAPVSARKLVQVYVSQLRKTLPAGSAITTRGSAYAIDLGPEALDAKRFERLVDEARDAGRTGNAALALSLVEQGLALWRGRAYGELAYDDFAQAESERLEELRLVALEERLSALLSLGRHDEVLAEARALAEAQPYRERPHELAILTLYRAGRQADALEHYAHVRARLDDELGLEPGPALRDLQRRILQQDPALAHTGGAVDSPPGMLPVPPNALVEELASSTSCASLLTRRDDRLIVLTGAGGSGKTRLAVEAARQAAGSYANGALFIELAPLRDPALVIPTIAHEVGLAVGSGDDVLDVLAATLATQETLLVLDNVEHVRDAATSFPLLIARAPRLTLLVTSRTVLHVSGERVVPVSPLPEDDALELFAHRTDCWIPSSCSAARTGEAREVCRRVDCLPLAVELAAARVRTLTPRALRSRLETRLGLLTGGPRDLPARQRTLRETIAWSVDLLDNASRQALARLSVFPAGAPLEAAEQVVGADLDTLSTLVDHHLVQRAIWRARPRLTVMETLHEYASELLADDPEDLEATRRRHAAWCLALVEQAEPNLSGDAQSEWLDELEAEHDSLRAALDFLDDAAETDLQLKLTILLSRFWYVRGFPTEGRRRLERVLDKVTDQPPLERRRAYTSAASLALLQGDYAAATALAERALEAARDADEPRFLANAYSNLGAIRLAGEDLPGAESALEEAVRLARDAGDERIAALAINNLGDLALTSGDYDRAGPLFDESLALLRAHEDTANIARSLFNNGAVDLMQGRSAIAEARFRESLELARRSGDREDIAWSLLGLSAVEDRQRQRATRRTAPRCARRVLSEMSAAYKPFERQLDQQTGSARARSTGTRIARLQLLVVSPFASTRRWTGARPVYVSGLRNVVEEVSALAHRRRAVDEQHERVVAGVAELQDRAGLDDEDAAPLELVALRRLAEIDRERPVEHDEDLLLRLVRMPLAARSRRIAPDVRARLRHRVGETGDGSPAAVVARHPVELGRAEDRECHGTEYLRGVRSDAHVGRHRGARRRARGGRGLPCERPPDQRRARARGRGRDGKDDPLACSRGARRGRGLTVLQAEPAESETTLSVCRNRRSARPLPGRGARRVWPRRATRWNVRWHSARRRGR